MPQLLALLSVIYTTRSIFLERIKSEYSVGNLPLNMVFSWVSTVVSSGFQRHFGRGFRLLARNVLGPKEVGDGESDAWLNLDG